KWTGCEFGSGIRNCDAESSSIVLPLTPAAPGAHIIRGPDGKKAMILLIDNYDSFTFNLVHFLGDLGAHCDVRRNDTLGVDEALALEPEAIVLSPGPCTPDEAGICVELIREAAGRIPLLGVC